MTMLYAGAWTLGGEDGERTFGFMSAGSSASGPGVVRIDLSAGSPELDIYALANGVSLSFSEAAAARLSEVSRTAVERLRHLRVLARHGSLVPASGADAGAVLQTPYDGILISAVERGSLSPVEIAGVPYPSMTPRVVLDGGRLTISYEVEGVSVTLVAADARGLRVGSEPAGELSRSPTWIYRVDGSAWTGTLAQDGSTTTHYVLLAGTFRMDVLASSLSLGGRE